MALLHLGADVVEAPPSQRTRRLAHVDRRESVFLDYLRQSGDQRAHTIAEHVLRVERLRSQLPGWHGDTERIQGHAHRGGAAVGLLVGTTVQLAAVRSEDVEDVHRRIRRIRLRQLTRGRCATDLHVERVYPTGHGLARSAVAGIAHLDPTAAEAIQPLEAGAT